MPKLSCSRTRQNSQYQNAHDLIGLARNLGMCVVHIVYLKCRVCYPHGSLCVFLLCVCVVCFLCVCVVGFVYFLGSLFGFLLHFCYAPLRFSGVESEECDAFPPSKSILGGRPCMTSSLCENWNSSFVFCLLLCVFTQYIES